MGVDLSKTKARLELFRKAKEEKKSRGEFLSLSEEGDYLIRLLPPLGDAEWCVEAYYHYGIKEGTSILCVKETFDQECPVCDMVDALFKTRNKEDREQAFRIRAKMRVMTNAILLSKMPGKDGADPDGKPKIFAFGTMIYEKILAYFNDDQYGDITDPQKGFDLKITRTGTGQTDTKYEVMARRNPSPVANWAEVQKGMVDLLTRVKQDIVPTDKLIAILEGREEEADAAAGETTTSSDLETPATPAKAEVKAPPVDDFGAPTAATKAAPATTTAPAAAAPSAQKTKLNETLAKLRSARGR